MSLILRNSCNHPVRFENELEKVWRHWLAPSLGVEEPQVMAPVVDLAETESEVIVKAELPGLTVQEIDVTLAEEILTIKGEKKQDAEEKGKRYHRLERRYGSFERNVRLPSPVDADGVTAKFENGVLEVTLPKTAEAMPKKIEIN